MDTSTDITQQSGSQGKIWRNILLLLLFMLLLVALWLIYSQINVLPFRDFVEYWASGRINNTGGNPYNPDQMLVMEQSVGWEDKGAVMMLNPPWTLPYGMFFGLFDYPLSRFLCFIIQIGTVFLCSILLWNIYHGNKRNEWIAWAILLTFGPLLHTLKAGQVTVLVLLGSVGFLYCLNKKSDFWAGVFASLVLVKPHLLYLFVFAVLLWSISHRRFRILAGMVVALIASTTVAWIFNPRIISQYIDMLMFNPPDYWMTSTLGGYLRVLFGPEKFYLQYLPSILGLAWFLLFWYKHHSEFDWIKYIPLLILVSFVTSSYGWTFDTAVVVWAIIQIAVLFDFRHWTFIKILIFITYWVWNLAISFLSLSQNMLWWFPSMLLIWYLIAFKYLTRNTTMLKNSDIPEAIS